LSDTGVTVLMPVRDYHAPYLQRALESIHAQTSPNWRLLVIDDGANGALNRIVGGLGDDRVQVVPSEPRGFAAALNTGMRKASTDFVSVLFGDDEWALDAVEVLTSSIERFRDVDLFHGSRQLINEEGRPISEVYSARESFTLADFEIESPVKHPMCWRRDLALELGGFDESLEPHGVDDYDFPWSLADAGARFMAVPDCLYLVRDHRDGFRLTTHVPRNVQLRTLRRIMGKHGVEIARHPSLERARLEPTISEAKRGYLRQSLYRSHLDRRLKELRGHNPRGGWRDEYRTKGPTAERPGEPRFAFGENWLRFLGAMSEKRVELAARSLRTALGVEDLSGRSFLDAGAGSGLLSLAATRLGASRVHSFDYDGDSVECARLLKERFAPDAENWTIEAGDLIDRDYCAALGTFDVVYSFGVVHHTGAMWDALDNLTITVAPEGLMFVSIYNHQGIVSDRWRKVKRLYNRLPARLRPLFAGAVWFPFEARYAARGLVHQPREYLRTWTRRDRGMSKWHDIVDWVGGNPFEVARPEQVLEACRKQGLELVGLATVGGSSACNEFVFRRSGG